MCLSNLVKNHHRSYMDQNKVMLHKITISQSAIKVDPNSSSSEAVKTKPNESTTVFDLRMENEQAERDFFKLLVISHIFN